MTKPRALYIHIPFCEHICDYCDFPKLQYFTNLADKYLNELEKELLSYDIGELDTIYIGGGTPTVLSDTQFEKLLVSTSKYSSNVKEFTVEANPESLTLSKIKLLKKYNVNRVSIGVESTHDNILNAINRHHSFEDVKSAVNLLIENGIDNINLDLILGLPNVTESLLIEDLNNILSLPIKHISCYSLTVSPHTAFYINGVVPASDDEMRKYYDIAEDLLSKKGFIHYEISNYCLPNYHSLHNLTYWKNERYYGVGMGASGYINNYRYRNTRSINDYLDGKYLAEKEYLSKKDSVTYYIMLNLRTIFGLNLKDFESKFAFDLYQNKSQNINELVSNNLLILKDDTLIPTYEGMMILDQVILKLI